MKLTDILKSANHNLFRNKVRTFLTVLAIFIGSFTIILNAAINAGVNVFIDKQIDSIGGDGYIEVSPSAVYEEIESAMGGNSSVTEYNPDKGSAETSYMTNEDFEKIRAIDGIEKIEPYHMATAEYITSQDTTKKYNVRVAIVADNSLKVDVSAGQQVDANSSEREVMLTKDYLEPLGFNTEEEAIGKTVTFGVKQTAKCYMVKNPSDCIATISAKVTGIQAPGILASSGSVRINPALNDALYNLAMDGVNDSIKNRSFLAIGNINPDKLPEIKKELEKLGFTALTVEDEAGMIRTFFDVILVVFNIFGAIALLAAAIGIINTLFMSVQERTREIGLDKALGLSKAKIFLSFSIEAVLLGFWGSVFGTLFSMLIGYSANAAFHQPGQFLESFPTFELVKFSPEIVAPIVLVIMFIAFLAGTAPAYQAAKKDPIEALRYE